MDTFKFIFVFLREFLVSNFNIAWSVVFRSNESIHPNFITFDVTGMTPLEIFILSQCITLTPGTTTIDLEPDNATLIVHAFDADDPNEVREGIENSLKKGILGFTR